MPGDPNSYFHAWAAGAPPTESSFPSSDAHYLNTPPFSLCIESERSENGFSQSVPSSVSIVFPPKFSLSIHRPGRNAVRVAAAGTSALCHRTKRSSCERVATEALLSLQRETDWGQKVRALREDLGAAEPLPRAPPRGFEQGVEPPGAEPLRREPLWLAGVLRGQHRVVVPAVHRLWTVGDMVCTQKEGVGTTLVVGAGYELAASCTPGRRQRGPGRAVSLRMLSCS